MTTKIEWTDETWNPVTGCTPISDGCKHCYARRMANRLAGRAGYPKENPFAITRHPGRYGQPFGWAKRRVVFVCSMGDLFHEDVDPGWIAAVLGACSFAGEHTFLLLTKRPGRMRQWFKDHDLADCQAEFLARDAYTPAAEFMIQQDERFAGKPALRDLHNRGINGARPHPLGGPAPWPLPNVWLGTTVENQQAASTRIPELLSTPAAVRFVSCEPLLERVDITAYVDDLDWIIVGGETGPGSRPMAAPWARTLRDDAAWARVPFFFKSWGDWVPLDQFRHSADGGDDEAGTLLNLTRLGARSQDLEGQPTFRVGKPRAPKSLDGVIHAQRPKPELEPAR